MVFQGRRAIFNSGGMLAAAAAVLVPITDAAAAPPLAAYGQLPTISNIAISGDGSKFAAIVGGEASAEIQIRMIADNKLVMTAQTEKSKLRDLAWVGSNHLVAVSSVTADVPGLTGGRREWFGAQEYDLTTKQWTPLLNRLQNSLNVLSGDPARRLVDGKPVVIAEGISFPGTQLIGQQLAGFRGVSTLYRISLDDQQTRLLETGNPDKIDWIIDAGGHAVARADYDQKRGKWTLFVRNGGGNFRSAYAETALFDRPYLVSLGRDPGTVLFGSHKSGAWETYAVNLADNSISAPIAELASETIITDPATSAYIGDVDTTLDDYKYRFLAESDQRVWDNVRKAFPGEIVTLASWSDDRMSIIVEVAGPTNGDAFFVVDRKAKTAEFIGDRYKGIAPADLGKVQSLTYKAGDGTEIPAYLTLPAGVGAAAKGLPLIVLAHGGPESRDDPGFDWWAQALASRGYAVLQPQFRGSSGFGAAHRDAGFGQWGRKMQTDLSDGVRHLAGLGTIDPKRVCIAGASYGGYAALAGATIDPEPYRCAASVAGVADLRKMLAAEISDTGSSRNSILRYWKRFMGADSAGDTKLDAISPARQAAQVKMPVLLIHGRDDTVVPYDQSVTMEKALKAAGASVEMVTLAGEDHWLSNSTTRIQMLTAMLAFLERHNPPGTAVKTAVVGR